MGSNSTNDTVTSWEFLLTASALIYQIGLIIGLVVALGFLATDRRHDVKQKLIGNPLIQETLTWLACVIMLMVWPVILYILLRRRTRGP